MSAYAFGSFGQETVGQARARACRRIAWTAGVTAGMLLLAVQAAAFLAVLHAGLSSREALLAGCVPLGGPVYGGVLLALRSNVLWAPLALLLTPLLAAAAVAIGYGVAARRARLDEEEFEEPEADKEPTLDDLLSPSAVLSAPLRPAAPPQPTTPAQTADPVPQPAPAPAAAPARPQPSTSPVETLPPVAETIDPALRQAQEEYEAARARIADILKQK